MNQYLSFKLINKNNPDIKIDLGYWCTSIARSICYNFGNIFKYTESNITLDIDTLDSYIREIQEGISEYKKNLHAACERKKENLELLIKAQTQDDINFLKEKIDDNEYSILDWEDEVKVWSDVENRLNLYLFILQKNKNEWDLVYRNC